MEDTLMTIRLYENARCESCLKFLLGDPVVVGACGQLELFCLHAGLNLMPIGPIWKS